MDGLQKILCIIVIILAVILVLVLLVALGFYFGCKSTEGLGFISKHMKPDTSLTNLENNRVLYDMMEVFLKYTKHITVWPVYGTLLGFIRENKIICYDYDLDFGIYEDRWDDMKKALEKLVKDNPEYGYMRYDFHFMKYAQLYHKKTMLGCDVSVYLVKNGKVIRNLLMNAYKYNTEDVFPLGKMTVKHQYKDVYFDMAVPANPDAILKTCYGENYMTPDHKCDNNCENCIKV